MFGLMNIYLNKNDELLTLFHSNQCIRGNKVIDIPMWILNWRFYKVSKIQFLKLLIEISVINLKLQTQLFLKRNFKPKTHN